MASDHKDRATALDGLLVVDKPEGPTSFDVVARVRRLAEGARTGHAGTLDPLASGVLVLALGTATKSIERLMDTVKRYRTTVDLSAFTTTDDREGERTEVAVAEPPSEEDIRAALVRFEGVIEQRPPAFSAMKVRGRRAYSLARVGAPTDLPPRPVRIDRIALVSYAWPWADIEIICGKGTYIRSIARDLGLALGTGGHCATLRRTAVGPFDDRMAWPLGELPSPIRATHLMPVAQALAMLDRSR
jgi:tRNA pseudouridine55 synthase